MHNPNRRTFIVQTIGLCAALAATRSALAALPLVDENDATAKTLGYRARVERRRRKVPEIPERPALRQLPLLQERKRRRRHLPDVRRQVGRG